MNKIEFTKLLKMANINQKEFANLSKLATSTVNNWNDKNKPIPDWVESWLTNYIDKKKFDSIKNIIADEINNK